MTAGEICQGNQDSNTNSSAVYVILSNTGYLFLNSHLFIVFSKPILRH